MIRQNDYIENLTQIIENQSAMIKMLQSQMGFVCKNWGNVNQIACNQETKPKDHNNEDDKNDENDFEEEDIDSIGHSNEESKKQQLPPTFERRESKRGIDFGFVKSEKMLGMQMKKMSAFQSHKTILNAIKPPKKERNTIKDTSLNFQPFVGMAYSNKKSIAKTPNLKSPDVSGITWSENNFKVKSIHKSHNKNPPKSHERQIVKFQDETDIGKNESNMDLNVDNLLKQDPDLVLSQNNYVNSDDQNDLNDNIENLSKYLLHYIKNYS